MYHKLKLRGAVRVDPVRLYSEDLEISIFDQLRQDFEDSVDIDAGKILKIVSVDSIGEGTIIPGDGAAYYETDFTVLAYQPDNQEIIEGTVKDIASFGAFIDFGPFEGMVHISQTMEDFVSLDDKSQTLAGKDSKRVLKVGDVVRARIIAISYKDSTNPKIGLTMRQPCLGKLEWIAEAREEKKVKTIKKVAVTKSKK